MMPNLINQVRFIIRNLAYAGNTGEINDTFTALTHICDILSTMLDLNTELSASEIDFIDDSIVIMKDQIELVKDQPEAAHDAMVTFTKLLALLVDLMREKRELQKLAFYSSLEPKSIHNIWRNFYKAVDECASGSEDPESIREIYDSLIVMIILDTQDEGLISEAEDPRQSPKILAIVSELTRGLLRLDSMSQ
ncbi:hypothetical protein PENSTE_c014G00520 [Penicillium steckii]|uniref:Uncharacterized protein n=1 Tax=Penicillium steckii TaxID=303698 RepID=A0A1V6T1D9_9EURO|nr:hypothetical protein PENSTE_c014G00520 [Penicillium steckii]